MRVMSEEKLSKLEAFIKEYAHENNGDVPPLAEIMDYMGMVKSVAFRYMMTLKERGKVNYTGKGTMEIANGCDYYKKFHSVKVPIYGSVICGSPEEEEQQNDGYLALPEEWVKGECFLLRTKGDSMTGAGIGAGDLVLVRRTNEDPQLLEGKIIVALNDGENTLKRLIFKKGVAYLHAENEKYEDIPAKNLVVQGIVLKIIKDVS